MKIRVIDLLRCYFMGGENINLDWLKKQLEAIESISEEFDRDYIDEVLRNIKQVNLGVIDEGKFRIWVGIQIQLPIVQ